MGSITPYSLCLIYGSLHFIGDFAFQSAWMAMEKGKNPEVLLYHCLTYTAPFALVIALLGALAGYEFNQWAVPVIFGTHFMVDTLSSVGSKYRIITKIWIDQLCHLSVLAALLYVGWL